jgi:hypothetical protein
LAARRAGRLAQILVFCRRMANQSDDWRRYLDFRCTGCGNCCRDTRVMISDADIRRIVDGTGKSFDEFARFLEEDEIILDKRSPWWVRFRKRRKVIALRWRNRSSCVFLDDATNRCTIYEHRPMACREHPFNVTLSDTGAVERISLSRIVKCPHEWDGAMTLRDVGNLRKRNDREADGYLQQVERWNRSRNGRKTTRGFLRFLGFER